MSVHTMHAERHPMLPRVKYTVGHGCARRGLWHLEVTPVGQGVKWDKRESEPLRDIRTFMLEHEKRVGHAVTAMLMARDVAVALMRHPDVAARLQFGGPGGAVTWDLAEALGQLFGIYLIIDDTIELPGRKPAENGESVRLTYSMRGCLVGWDAPRVEKEPLGCWGFLGHHLLTTRYSTDDWPAAPTEPKPKVGQ